MSIRGTQDLYKEQYNQYEEIKKVFFDIAHLYGAHGLQTSALDSLDLFVRTSGADADICQKEMFLAINKNAINDIVLESKSDLTVLKPEGTAPAIRALNQQHVTFNQFLKVAYFDRFYRYNRPQKGRLREFTQAGMEFFGSGAILDAQCINAAYLFMQNVKLDNQIKIHINTMGNANSKTIYKQILKEYFTINQNKINTSTFEKALENPLLALDKLTTEEKQTLVDLPKMYDYLDKESQEYFSQLQDHLTQLNIPFTLDPTIVRGLDYYTHTVFEFISTLSASQGTILAGGRYDNLISLLTKQTSSGIGWGAGVERIMLLINQTYPTQPKINHTTYIINLNTPSRCLDLQQQLHKLNFPCMIINAAKLDQALKQANQAQAEYIVISGTNEAENNVWIFKEMSSGQNISHSTANLIEHIVKLNKRFY